MDFFKVLLIVLLLMGVLKNSMADINHGLLAYYPFNGNANDESGNKNHGIVNGATLIYDRLGNFESAYHFDGMDDFIEITPSSDVSMIRDFSISVWAYHSTWKSQPRDYPYDRQYIFDGHSKSSTADASDIFRPGFNVIFDNESSSSRESIYNHVLYSINSFTGGNIPASLNGEWKHIVFMRNGKKFYTYLNGELLTNNFDHRSDFSDEYLNMTHQWFIGTFAGNNKNYVPIQQGFNYSFNGVIDDIRIYDRILSLDDVQQLYKENILWDPDVKTIEYCKSYPKKCGMKAQTIIIPF